MQTECDEHVRQGLALQERHVLASAQDSESEDEEGQHAVFDGGLVSAMKVSPLGFEAKQRDGDDCERGQEQEVGESFRRVAAHVPQRPAEAVVLGIPECLLDLPSPASRDT